MSEGDTRWSAPAMEGSDESGPEKSGSGSPAEPLDVTSSLFQVSVALHALAGIVAVAVLGVAFGWFALAASLFAVTGYWMILLNRYSSDEERKKIDQKMMEERAMSSRFNDPRNTG